MTIKERLRNWLFSGEIHRIEQLEKENQKLQHQVNILNSVCDIGVDVGLHSKEHSWAVICIHGQMDYVKFVQMTGKDIREIASFLKRFTYSNRCIDSPFKYINDMILK